MRNSKLIVFICLAIIVSGIVQATTLSNSLSAFTSPITLSNYLNITTSGVIYTIQDKCASNTYCGHNIQNTNPNGSTDISLGNDLTTNTDFYIDMGITGTTYNDQNFINATPANTSYIIAKNTSLYFGASTNKIMKFFLGTFTSPQIIFNVTTAGIVMDSNTNLTTKDVLFSGGSMLKLVTNDSTILSQEIADNTTQNTKLNLALTNNSDAILGSLNVTTRFYIQKNFTIQNTTGQLWCFTPVNGTNLPSSTIGVC